MAFSRSKQFTSEELNDQVPGKTKGNQNVQGRKYNMNGLDICNVHGETFKYVCVNHDNIYCSDCVIEDHRGCNVNKIVHEVTKDKVSLSDVEDTEKSTNDLLKKLKARSVDNELHKQYKRTIETIDEAKQTMITKFEDLKATVIAEYQQVEKAEKAYADEIQSNMAKCDDIIDKIQNSAERLSTVERDGSDDQKYTIKKIIGGVTSAQIGDVESMRSKLYRMNVLFQMCDQLNYLLSPERPLATFFINHVPLYAKTNLDAMAVTLTLAASIDLKKDEGNDKVPSYAGSNFLTDGRIIAIDDKNKRLDILDDHLNKLGTYRFKHYPYGVVAISDEKVVVTCGYVICFLQVSKSNDIKLIEEVKLSVFCYSISVIDDKMFLVSTIDNKQFMKMVSITGDETDFTNLPDKEYNVLESQCTYIRNSNMVVHTDRYMHTVTIYQNEGTTLTPSVVVSDPRIKEPRGLCCGDDDSLFVCNEETDTLVHLTHGGDIIDSYKLDMSYPRAVCVSKDGKRLAVSNSLGGENKLQLYDVTKKHL